MHSEEGALAARISRRRPTKYLYSSAAAAMLPSVSCAVADLSAARTASSRRPSAAGAPSPVPIASSKGS